MASDERSPGEAHLAEAARLLDRAIEQLSAALDAGLPAVVIPPARYVSAEARVCRRRLANLRRVIQGTADGRERD